MTSFVRRWPMRTETGRGGRGRKGTKRPRVLCWPCDSTCPTILSSGSSLTSTLGGGRWQGPGDRRSTLPPDSVLGVSSGRWEGVGGEAGKLSFDFTWADLLV